MSLNRLWAALAVDTCVALGVDHFFIAPGSRCTPLTLAVAQNRRAHVIQHFDERGLAFAAVGYGRSGGRPGVVICTSGTAVANVLPAVVEASMEHVPLILLTADRPPELRDAGANQTIDQVALFGRYPRWFFDMPCPTDQIAPSFVRSQLQFAIGASKGGPVHLNMMYREPFEASDDPVDLSDYPSSVPQVDVTPARPAYEIAGGNTLVVVGGSRSDLAKAACDMAARVGAPCLGDVTSGLRSHAYDLALLKELPAADTILHVGGRIVSKNWLRYRARCQTSQLFHLDGDGPRINPQHQLVTVISGDIAAACRGLSLRRTPSPNFVDAWRQADELARRCAEDVLKQAPVISEPWLAAQVAALIPDQNGLFLGNSMPVRDFDRYAFWAGKHVTVAANRGASGIDGQIASAVGFASGLHQPVTLVLGDLSALHDLNSLALVQQSTYPITIVIINNHGGGIFDLLPVAGQTTHFERYFTTPHSFQFGQAAAMFSLDYHRPTSVDAWQAAYTAAVHGGRSCVIEVVTDRSINLQVRQAIESSVRKA